MNLLDLYKKAKRRLTTPQTPEAIWEWMTETERDSYTDKEHFVKLYNLSESIYNNPNLTIEGALKAYGLTESDKIANQKEMIEIMKEAEPELYKKSGRFEARLGKSGEHIITTIDGEDETKKTVKDGEIVVKGPKGELYVISDKKFRERYEVDKEPTDKYQKYKATGLIRAYEYAGEDFKFTASWDEEMICKPGDYLASPVKDAKDTNYPEVYRIERSVFDDTYSEVME